MIKVGVVGAGYWGPKHVRNFSEMPGARVAMVADLSEARLTTIRAQYPDVRTTTDFCDAVLVSLDRTLSTKETAWTSS
jgi:predicted dehydrogenase